MPDRQDIWTRLAKLDHCCHVSIHSLYVVRPDGRAQREWEVTIRHKEPRGEARLVRVRDEMLVEAVMRALAQADARGWPDSPPAPSAD
jgi:hypothetical protein